jgi:hypothetical protein
LRLFNLQADDHSDTALNAWRIYRTRCFTPESFAAFLPVFVVIIESGAFYSTSILMLLLTFFIGSNGQYTMLDIVTPIVVSSQSLDPSDSQQFCSGDHILPHHSASTFQRRWQVASRKAH